MKLQKITLLAFFALMGGLASAQVKVGTNPGTIGSSSNLEVEASGGKKLTVDKTSGALSTTGTVTVADGSQGAGKVLTSDANGLATWASLPTSTVFMPSFTGAGTNNDGGVAVVASAETVGGTFSFPTNGFYAINWDVRGELSAAETSASVFAVRLYNDATGGQVIGEQQLISPGNTFIRNSGMRIVEITTAPVTYSIKYGSSSAQTITTYGSSGTSLGWLYWIAYKLK